MLKINTSIPSFEFNLKGDNRTHYNNNHNATNIIRNGEGFNKHKQNYFLGAKRKPENKLESQNLIKLIKNSGEKGSNNNDQIIGKKIEFKLSHVLHGENTIIKTKSEEELDKSNTTSNTISNSNKPKEFYSDEMVDKMIGWKKQTNIGPGLNNLGNTCFLNSVLQSLLYTSSLRNYLTHTEHLKICKVKGICFMCELGKLIGYIDSKNSQSSSNGNNQNGNNYYSITPRNIIQNLHSIAKTLRVGRQEDSHEFLLYLLDALEKSAKSFKQNSLNTFISNSNDNSDNLIQKIFGGKLISSVTCSKCKKSSNKIDNFLDVSLQIFNSDSLEKSFEIFCKPEYLMGNNKFYCENCKTRNDSVKRFQFEKLPRVLILHLKRFDNFQRKINKYIKYENVINLTRFVHNSGRSKEEYKYRLYSVLIHDGFSVNSGHYHCFVKNSNGVWYSMNDSYVSKASEKNVFYDQHTPYILFYERIIEKPKVVEEKTIERNMNVNSKIVENVAKSMDFQNNSIQHNEMKINTSNNQMSDFKLDRNNQNVRVDTSVSEDKTKIQENKLNKDLSVIDQTIKDDTEKKIVAVPESKKILSVDEMHIERNSSRNPSECDTQDCDSEENNSMKIPLLTNFKFKSPKLAKMKSILKWMKNIQNSRSNGKTEEMQSIEIPEKPTTKDISDSNEELKITPFIAHKEKNENFTNQSKVSNYDTKMTGYSGYDEIQNYSKENKSNSKNKYLLKKHLSSFYGGNHIDLWDTEDESDLLDKQMTFVKSSESFKSNKPIQKDEYDIDYDSGKLKKVKKLKEDNRNHNVFQKHHNHIAYEKNNGY